MSEFNLLDEKWIKVQSESGSREVGLLEFFENAHNYTTLDGELPTQNFAVLRLLLAIMYAALYKNIESYDDAVDLWLDIYKRGKFDYPVIRGYLENYRDRFYLFDEKYPFYQVNGIKGTDNDCKKLNGDISESGNKIRIFSLSSGNGKEEVTYSEAARWILHTIGYDDTSAKPKTKGLESPGAGWIGQLGGLYIEKSNLFETLIYNFCVINNESEPWKIGIPPWEKQPSSDERKKVITPNDPLSMFTIMSRKLILLREDSKIVGYSILGGDYFLKRDTDKIVSGQNAFAETMTLWRNANASKKNAPKEFVPKRHSADKLLWTSLDYFLINTDDYHKPAILSQISDFENRKIIDSEPLEIKTVGMIYGDKDTSIADVYEDFLKFDGELLTKLGEVWCNRISSDIEITEKLCNTYANLAGDLYICAGGDEGKNAALVGKMRSKAKSEAYFLLDTPFRNWISGIKVSDNIEEKSTQWWNEAQGIIKKAGKELTEKYSLMLCKERGDKGYTIPQAIDYFEYKISSKEALLSGGKK
jgi:CRISPR system Cascade subunit CasA